VPRNATLDQVKDQFRRLALKCHPDLVSKPPEEFLMIKEAYEVLHNKESKLRYDNFIGNHITDKIPSTEKN
jgi:curved DNA-binding protein CbpA